MNTPPSPTATSAALAATNTDLALIALFEDDLAPLESDEEHAISHEQFKRLAEIREDMASIKKRINARLTALGHVPLYDV